MEVVRVVSKKLVKPASPTPQNLRNLPISSLDQLAGPLYWQVILYYEPTNVNDGRRGDNDYDSQVVKRKLEESLASVLSLYYPLAGRYMRDQLVIDCNDQGAELLEAKVSCNLSQLLNGDDVPAHLLVASGFESPATPLLIVQLNEFDCGGIAIGLTTTHRIIDGFTVTQFIRGWSVACSQGIEEVHCPSFELASLFPARDGLSVVYPSAPSKKDGVKIVTRRFLFNEEAIRTLKAVASGADPERSGSFGRRFSRGEVVTALIWMVLIRISQAKNNGNLRPSLLSQPANLRVKIRIPVPPNSCGNFVIRSIAKFVPTNGKCVVDFAELVCLLHDSVRSTINRCAEFMTSDDLETAAGNVVREIGNAAADYEVDICRFSNWCSLPLYEADFGWGKPTWISSPKVPVDRYTVLVGTKDGKGVEAWVNLDENDMLPFQQHPEIAAFTVAA